MKGCKFCDKKGLLILPLRYAAVLGAQTVQKLPSLPSTLGENVSDLVLEHGKYAPRFLRQGYLYVLIKRPGVLYWEAYCVLEEGFLYKFPFGSPPTIIPEFSCDRSVCGVDASMLSINDVDSVEKIYLLFAPSAMTIAKLDDYKAKADSKVDAGKMQVFDPKGWATNQTAQKHSISAQEVGSHVVEFLLYKQGAAALQSDLGKGMLSQLFPPIDAAFAGMPAPSADSSAPGRLGQLEHKMKKTKAAAFVMHDHIGITQELNDYRNAALEGIEHYLAATDEYGATNLHRLQVYEAIEEVRVGFEQGIVKDTKDFLELQRLSSVRRSEMERGTVKALRQMGRQTEAELVEKSIEDKKKSLAKSYDEIMIESRLRSKDRWNDKYGGRLDTEEMKLFKDTLNKRSEDAFASAKERLTDHLKWFESSRLVDAFEVFDSKSLTAGYDFAIESTLCTLGLSSCTRGAAKIDSWVQASTIESTNLYMRGFYNNQDELIAAAKKTFDDIQALSSNVVAPSDMTAAAVIKATKGLIDAFKKTDAAFDEWARNQDQNFSKKWVKPSLLGKALGKSHGLELIFFHNVSEITRTVFRNGLGSKLDVALVAHLSGVLYARLGEIAHKLRYDELMLRIDPATVRDGHKGRSAERNAELKQDKASGKAAQQMRNQIAPSLGDLVADAQQKVKLTIKLPDIIDANKSQQTNNYHQSRIGILLACIELIGIGEKIANRKWGGKAAIELIGSVMSLGSVVLDTYYSAAKSIREIEPYKSVSAISKSGDIVRGGFKFRAGVLGAGAAGCMAWLDFMKAGEEWNKQRRDMTLFSIYAVRSATGFVSAGLTVTASLSYAAPLCEHLAKGAAPHRIFYKRALAAAAVRAVSLSARVRLLVWVARMNWIGLGLVAAELGYLYIKDNELQDWCDKSVFRKVKRSKNWLRRTVVADYFPNSNEELEGLANAAIVIRVGE